MTNSEKGVYTENKEITETQLDFLNICQEIQWGKLEVVIQNGEPVFSRELERTHQHKKHKS